LNWQKAFSKGSFQNRIMEFCKNLIQFRKDLKVFENKDFRAKLTYHYDNGEIAKEENTGYWENYSEKFFGFLINGIEKRVYVALNQTDKELGILLPKNSYNTSWHIVSDSSNLSHIDFSQKDYLEKEYILNPNSLSIFMES
jgi:pullulanase/glycogen debranching enzyme